jgi:hypothetical protein
MRQFLRVVGWLITSAGILFSLLACWGLIYTLVVPDTSGSPDARGMLFGSSLFLLLIIGLPVVTLGAIVLGFTRKRPPVDAGQSI